MIVIAQIVLVLGLVIVIMIKIVQLSIQRDSDRWGANSLIHLDREDCIALASALLERVSGNITSTGDEKSQFSKKVQYNVYLINAIQGKKLSLVKLIKDYCNLKLKEAKEVVDKLELTGLRQMIASFDNEYDAVSFIDELYSHHLYTNVQGCFGIVKE